jgi:hypothetical protein
MRVWEGMAPFRILVTDTNDRGVAAWEAGEGNVPPG